MCGITGAIGELLFANMPKKKTIVLVFNISIADLRSLQCFEKRFVDQPGFLFSSA